MKEIVAYALTLAISLSFEGCSSKRGESDVIIVNIRNLDREQIANELIEISKYNPKVIAIDAIFQGEPTRQQDISLIKALTKCKKLVVPSFIANFNGIDPSYTHFDRASDLEYVPFAKTGFTNARFENEKFQSLDLTDSMTAEYQNDREFYSLRRISLYENVGGKVEYQFSVRTAIEFDSLQTMLFIAKHPRIIEVDYKNGNRKFPILESDEILGHKISLENIEQKIILMGDIGQSDYDLFFTPLNDRKKNPPEPDMYGVVFLANVIAQILEFRE